MLPLPGALPPPILKHLISLANRETEEQKMETRIIYSVCVYQRRGGDSRGQGEGTKVKATKTRGGSASPSYNPP